MRKLLILTSIAAFLSATSVYAQTSAWTLEACIEHALANSISVKQSELSVEQGEIDLNTAKSNRLPDLSAGVSQNFSFGRGLDADNTYVNSNTTSTGFNLGAGVVLFRGFQLKNSIERSNLNLSAAVEDLKKAKEDIRIAVGQAYVQILYNMEILEVAENQIEIDENQLYRLKKLLENGKASAVEVAQQEASLAQSEYQKTQAESTLKMSLLNLSQLLELPDPENFTIVPPSGDLQPVLIEKAEDVYLQSVGLRPGIVAQEKRLAAAKTGIEIAKGQFYPSLSLSGGIGSNYYTSSNYKAAPFSSQIENNFSQYVSLSLSIPIFSRYSNRNSVRSARVAYNAQQLQLDKSKKDLYKEIQQAYYNAVTAQDKYLSSKQVAASSKASFDLVMAKYESGKSNITEFNEAKNNMVRAESELLRARYENVFQSAILNFYKTGTVSL